MRSRSKSKPGLQPEAVSQANFSSYCLKELSLAGRDRTVQAAASDGLSDKWLSHSVWWMTRDKCAVYYFILSIFNMHVIYWLEIEGKILIFALNSFLLPYLVIKELCHFLMDTEKCLLPFIYSPHTWWAEKNSYSNTQLAFKSLLAFSFTLMLMLYKFNVWNSFVINQCLHFIFYLI